MSGQIRSWFCASIFLFVPQAIAADASTRDADLQEAVALNAQAIELFAQGDLDAALPRAERVLVLIEKTLGSDAPQLASSLDTLARIVEAKGDIARAEPLHRRALSIREKAFGPSDLRVAQSLYNLAGVLRVKEDLAGAEPLFRRALGIQEKALGSTHTDLAPALNGLASLLIAKGNYAAGEPLSRRALAISEKAFGPDHPAVAISLANVAAILFEKKDYTGAEKLLRRRLTIGENAFGPDHPNVATSLNGIATVLVMAKNPAGAEPLYRRALAIREKAFGPDHPDVAWSLNNLAGVLHLRGDRADAELLYRRALAIHEKALGPDHPAVATTLLNLAGLRDADGDIASAIAFQRRAGEIRERSLEVLLNTGSEAQRLAYLATLDGETDGAVSLHARSAPANAEAARLALTTIFRRKGRVLDALSQNSAVLRMQLDPGDDRLDRLAALRAQLASRVLSGPGDEDLETFQQQVSAIASETEALEMGIGERIAAFRTPPRMVTLEAVQSAIPEDAALVEIVLYKPFHALAKSGESLRGDPRYAAYVLHAQGEPAMVDLGDAASIDRAAGELRAALATAPNARKKSRGGVALTGAKRVDVRALARTFDETVMRPIRGRLGDTRRILLAPDGALNLVPFAALIDEDGRFLAERFYITYLTSGRDVLRLATRAAEHGAPLILADPDFAKTPKGSASNWSRLPGTSEEGVALAKILPDAKLLTRANATETALKATRAPRILHLATHGFFLPDQSGAQENPLLRSGVVLAGANAGGSGTDDGVLTALEASGLDLSGTELVVMSACETGVGDVKRGDGVYGLRRALVVAGAESQVMSLWKVDDAATRDLMVTYYTRLAAGEPRSEALRRVQLEMLSSATRSDPYYWAAFIPSGQWAPLATP